MSQETDLMKYVLEDVRKYDGIRMPLKASFPERLFVRKLAGKKLHPNPDDEFSMPSVGPSYSIISEYASKISRGKYWNGNYEDEPLYIEKMYPDGYMILNGHHRWAAAMRTGMRRIPVRIVNMTSDADIDKALRNTSNEKRVSFDLDEVVFCDNGVFEKKPFLLPGSLNREQIRLGMPALTHFLVTHGYDIWAYTRKYYSDDYIKHFLKAYHIKINGVITGFSRKRWKKNKLDEQIEKKIMSKYTTTLNITNDEIIKIENRNGIFEQFDLDCNPEDWSKNVIKIIKSWDDEES